MFDEQFMNRPLAECPIVVLDTETTGLYPGLGHRVTEIGAIRFIDWEPVGQMSTLLNPQRPIEPKASEITGITDAQVAVAPKFNKVAEELITLIDDALLVAHNASFDASFVGLEMVNNRSPHIFNSTEPLPANPWLCTLELSRKYFHFGRNNLANVARKLNVRVGNTHRALQDVFITAEVCRRMMQKLSGQSGWKTVGDFLHAQGGGIYAPTPPDTDHLPDEIVEAMENGRSLNIHYYAADSQETDRTITPLYPTFHRGTGYLIAFCHNRQQQRTFHLDRILSATII